MDNLNNELDKEQVVKLESKLVELESKLVELESKLVEEENKKVKFLTRREVLEITGKSNPTLWRWTKAGTFPKPYKLGESSVGWKDNEIHEWIGTRPHAETGGLKNGR